MVFEGTLGVGVGILLGLAFLKYSGYVDQLKKELGYVGAGAVFLLLSAVLGVVGAEIPAISTAVMWINIIFFIIAFILVLIGAIGMAMSIFSKIK